MVVSFSAVAVFSVVFVLLFAIFLIKVASFPVVLLLLLFYVSRIISCCSCLILCLLFYSLLCFCVILFAVVFVKLHL